MLTSSDGTITYIGITSDVDIRLEQHNGRIPGGAKATRRGRPWTLTYVTGPFDTLSDAMKWEHSLKKLKHIERIDVQTWNDNILMRV